MGAQRKALNNIKTKYDVVGMAEWFVPAIVTYQAMHNNLEIDMKTNYDEMVKYMESKTLSMNSKDPVRDGYWKRVKLDKMRIYYSAVKASEVEGNIFDVRTLYKRKLNDVDLLTYSFPCQDLSQQGIQKGMTKGSGTRSGLLWEIERALDNTRKTKLPKYLLMENVVSLTYKNNKKDLKMWMKKLEQLGYKNDIKILNASHFGSSQARRRAFMVSTLGKKIILPTGIYKPKPLKTILNKEADKKDILIALSKMELTDGKGVTKSNIKKSRLPYTYTTFNSEAYVYNPNYTGPTLTASGANSRIKIIYGNRIRKMNSLEAYKYMGFTSTDYKKIDKLNILSEGKKIYTCGNSISVQVLEAIFERIIHE